MITEVRADTAYGSGDALVMHTGEESENDLIQIRDIQGLDPVDSSITTGEYGDIIGESLLGTHIGKRNIVMTLRPNPDWAQWTVTKLRQYLYSYFISQRPTRLVFLSDELVPVEISGVVEKVEANLFSRDPEVQVSIICPDPLFKALDAIVVTGTTSIDPTTVPSIGNVDSPMVLKVMTSGDSETENIVVNIQPSNTHISVDAIVNSDQYFEMSSIPLHKYVRSVLVAGGFANLLTRLSSASTNWPVLSPKNNDVLIMTDNGDTEHLWELTYYPRFGGL